MSSNPHHESSSRPRQPITIVSTDQGPRVGPYIFGKTLGTGSTGKVKLAKNLVTGEIVAIKIVRKDYLDNKPSLKKKMRREISVLKVLSHPNLMSLIDVFEIETHLFLVMEYVDGCELFDYLVRRGALAVPQALGFFQQIICGLEYCHHRLICHRDLKPENLLLDRDNSHIKIADFGMTSLNPPGSLLETSCGSPHYCDPMVVSGDMYDGLKADIWSCGVILYAMVTGRLPFDDDNIQRLLQKVQAGHYHLPSELPKDLRDLIKKMLTVDPDQRITLEGIKAHPWFNSIPPRDYVEDNFVAPAAPIETPDPLIMKSLVDLGWGDVRSVTLELAKTGASMEKVFYEQLEKHPMYRRVTVPRTTHTNVGNSVGGNRRPTQDSSRSKHSEHHGVQGGNAQKKENNDGSSTPILKNPAPAVPKSNGGNAGSNDSQESVRVQLESMAVSASQGTERSSATGADENGHDQASDPVQESEDGENESIENDEVSSGRVKKTGDTSVNLVRQSSIRDMTGTAEERRDYRVEEAIQTVADGGQKSWFDSMRSMWTGNNHVDGGSNGGNQQHSPGENQTDSDGRVENP